MGLVEIFKLRNAFLKLTNYIFEIPRIRKKCWILVPFYFKCSLSTYLYGYLILSNSLSNFGIGDLWTK